MIKKHAKKLKQYSAKQSIPKNTHASSKGKGALKSTQEKSVSRKEREELKIAQLLKDLLNSEITEECPVVLNTSLSQLQGLNFSERERECMVAVLNAERMNSPILNGSVKLRYRIELAAGLLALLITKAHSLSESHRISKPNILTDLLINLTISRAKEIWSRRST